jgi:hypothetical protein
VGVARHRANGAALMVALVLNLACGNVADRRQQLDRIATALLVRRHSGLSS